MNVVRFPLACPVCGVTITSAPDAMANHGDCHRLAYRLAEHANAMKRLAEHWPAREVVRPPSIIRDPEGNPVEIRTGGF